jgi:hypothetical protein
VLIEFQDVKLTTEGRLKGRARVSGVSVLDYTELYGAWVYRPEEEVFKPESMDSLKGIPITYGHPPTNLTSETDKNYIIGYTGDIVERDGDSLIVNFTIIEAWAVKEILWLLQQGQRIQFSVGAWAFPEQTQGVYNGVSYQIIWRNILYNHLALLMTDPGRYPNTEIVTDSKAAGRWMLVMDGFLSAVDSNTTEVNTVKITLPSGFVVEITDAEAATELQKLVDGHKKLVTDHASVSGQFSQAQKDLSAARLQVPDANQFNKAVSARVELALEAQPLMDGLDVKAVAAMDETQIYESVLLKNGHTQAELDAQKAAIKDAYPIFLKGAYSQIGKAAGAQESEEVLDLAGQTNTQTRSNQGEVIVVDAFEAAKNKQKAGK